VVGTIGLRVRILTVYQKTGSGIEWIESPGLVRIVAPGSSIANTKAACGQNIYLGSIKQNRIINIK